MRWLYGVEEAADVLPELAQLIDADRADPARNQHLALQIVGMARENRPIDQSRQWFDQLRPESSALDLLRNGLTGALRGDATSRLCHEYLLEAVQRFSRAIPTLSDRQRYLWSLAEVESVLATDSSTAREIVAGIAESYPRDATIQRRFGELLVAGMVAEPDLATQALKQWRKIAAAARPHSDDWYTAKLQVARLLVAGNQQADAKKMLKFMRAVPPGWTQSPLADQFDQLLLEVGGSD